MNILSNFNILNFFGFGSHSAELTEQRVALEKGELPDELWMRIFDELDPVSIIKTSMASKRHHDLANDTGMWEAKVRKFNYKVRNANYIKKDLASLHEIRKKFGKKSLESRIASRFGLEFWSKFELEKNEHGEANTFQLHCWEKIYKSEIVIDFVAISKFNGSISKLNTLGVTFWEIRDIFLFSSTQEIACYEYQDIPDSLVNYMDRITAGETCGLYTEQQEDNTYQIVYENENLINDSEYA